MLTTKERKAAGNNQEFMWSAQPGMNSRLDEPPNLKFCFWKLEANYRPKAVLSLPKQRKLRIVKLIQKQIDKCALTADDLQIGKF